MNGPRTALVSMFVLFAAVSLQAAPPTAAARERARRATPPGDETWQVIYLGKNRIGYSRTSTVSLLRDGKPLIKCASVTRLSFKRFGQAIDLETTQETEELPDGELVAFVFEMKTPPAGSTRTTGRVVDNRLAGETVVAATSREYSIPWEPGTKSPAYVERLPRLHLFNPGESTSFRVFLPERTQISEVRLSAGRREHVSLLDGRRHTLLKLTTMEAVPPQSTTQSYLGERGEALVSTTEVLGQSLTSYAVTAEEALKQVAGQELDLAACTLVRSTVIPQAHRTKRAVYRIRLGGEDPTPYFPNGPTQKVVRRGIDECEITVRSVAPEMSRRSIRVSREFLAGSNYLQTTDPDVLMHVDRAARNLADPAQIAVAMEKYVNRQMQKKDFSTALASAAEVARSLQGDCTEHAVLLAAMLRARNIPSRIVVGLVYIESLAAFGGHMWTEALLGDRWVALDATLGQGGIGAAHIKLGDSSFSDAGPAPVTAFLPMLHVLGRMELTVVESSTK